MQQQMPPLAVMIPMALIGLAVIGGLGALFVTTALDVWASPKMLLLQLSARSITSHKVKSAIVGGLLAGGTMLLVVGLTFIANTKNQMETTITGGLVGHIQIDSSEAKDDLAFFGMAAGGSQDLGVISDFSKVKNSLMEIPNIKAVVPMGRDIAMAIGGNEFDERLEELRNAAQAHDAAKLAPIVGRIRHMLDLLKKDRQNRGEISSNTEELKANIDLIDQALAPQFWAAFDADPFKTADFLNPPMAPIDFLDTKIAPLQADEATLMLPYIGTDVDQYAKEFSRFRIDTDNGSRMIPTGQRGFLFNRRLYEEQVKNKVAHALDVIKDTMRDDQTTIAADIDLQEQVKKNIKQFRRITYQLTAEDAAKVTTELRSELPGVKGELDDLLQAFLDVNDANFNDRYKWFYDHIAPRIRLYSIKVGDTITMRAFSKTGYSRAANLHVYGTFHFDGIDGSPVASRYNFVDIMSFRDLYGLMTPEKRKELDAIKAQVGVKEVDRGDAEAALFGSDTATAAATEKESTAFGDPTAQDTVAARKAAAEANAKPFTHEDIENGVVLNAAILLKNPRQLSQTMAEITRVNKEKGLHIQAIDWVTASGIVGQLIGVLSMALLITIGIIFIVTLVIINNSMVMATMDRMVEIGMMRAIGAQRRFVRAMYMLETVALASVAAVVGSILGAAIVLLYGKIGLRAPADLLVIMFGGRWLHPVIDPASFVISLVLIGLVALIATFYPALIATRIPPIVAMQRRE